MGNKRLIILLFGMAETHIYAVRYHAYSREYWIMFYNDDVDQLYKARIDFVPTEEQMTLVVRVQGTTRARTLEDGPSPHFALYKE